MLDETIWEPSKRYASAVDLLHFEYFRLIFTTDARLFVGVNDQGKEPMFVMEGIEQIEAAMQGLKAYDRTFHQLGQQRVLERDGDTVSTETYCTASHFYRRDGQDRCYTMFIRYRDRLVKRGEGWLFTERLLHVDAEQGQPA